MVLRR